MIAQDAGPTAIADAAGVSQQVVYRVQDDPAKAEAMLAEWGFVNKGTTPAATPIVSGAG